MTQEIKRLKEKFLKKFPSNQNYFTTEDIGQSGLPNPILQRLIQIAKEAVAFEIKYPETKWADAAHPAVIEKWNAYRAHLLEFARIPAENLDEALEYAISDTISLLSSPRSFIPEFIYGDADTLDGFTVMHRCQDIVVYPYFGAFMQKYITKKNPDYLTKARFTEIISSVDEKLTSGYRFMDWATLLSPVFELFEDKVPSSFFSTFYTDKGMAQASAKFSNHNGTCGHDLFIELLAMPDTELPEETFQDIPANGETVHVIENNEAETENNQPAEEKLIEQESVQSEEIVTPENEEFETEFTTTHHEVSETVVDSSENTDELDSTEIIEQDLDLEELTLADSFVLEDDFPETTSDDELEENPSPLEELQEIFGDSDKKSDDDEEVDIPLYKLHTATFEDEDDVESEVEDEGEETAVFSDDEMDEELPDDQPLINLYSAEDSVDDLTEEDISEDETNEEVDPNEEEVPMWKTFSRDEIEDELPVKYPEPDISKPFMRVKMFEPPIPENATQMLIDHLSTMREAYVRDLFNGDESSYDYSVDQIAHFSNWREAGRYLTNEVFKRNTIDMYSDTAVDFTDKLHKFFINRERQKH